VTSGDRGRCDLWLDIEGRPPSTVAIEVKIFASYTKRQRERYIRELRRRGRERNGLVVITTRAHKPAPRALLELDEWLGEVHWADLDEHGLANLPFADAEGPLPQAWRAFVDALRGRGDLGGIAAVNVHRLGTWIPDKPDAKWEAAALLDAIAQVTHDDLSQIIAGYELTARRRLGTAGGSLVHAQMRSYVELNWGLSSSGSEEVKLIIARGESSQIGPQLNLELRFVPRPAQRRSGLLTKTPSGFTPREDWAGTWVRRVTVPIDPHMTQHQVRALVLKHWRSGLRALDRAGAFSSLRAR
jgi:hypothetical protein